MQRTLMLLAVLGLSAWTASSVDAAHQSDVAQRDFSSSLRLAPDTLTLNQPSPDQLAGHCGGGGYYGGYYGGYRGGYYGPRYQSYRPMYYGGYGYPGYYGGQYGGHHYHRGGGGFGLYIGF